MIAKLTDENTLVVEPENVAELSVLLRLEGATVKVEPAKPFAPNVATLKIERPK